MRGRGGDETERREGDREEKEEVGVRVKGRKREEEDKK